MENVAVARNYAIRYKFLKSLVKFFDDLSLFKEKKTYNFFGPCTFPSLKFEHKCDT